MYSHFYSNCRVFCLFFNSSYEELEKSGLLQPLVCQIEGDRQHAVDTKHFIAKRGMASLVEYYLTKSGMCMLMALHCSNDMVKNTLLSSYCG